RVVGPGSEPAWSADSGHLAYTGPGDAGSGASDIWVADTADPTQPRPLRTPGDDSSPTWSPDGRLASVSELGVFVSDAPGGARTAAWVIAAADGTAAFVADDVSDARFSPDGTHIAGYRHQGGSPTPAPLVSWRTDGSDRREILAPPADLTVTGLDWAPDGKSL